MTRSDDILNGMKAICGYLGRSEVTVINYHREFGLPIKKARGSWMGSKKAIDRWNHDMVSAE